jgi:hypothetical protein
MRKDETDVAIFEATPVKLLRIFDTLKPSFRV